MSPTGTYYRLSPQQRELLDLGVAASRVRVTADVLLVEPSDVLEHIKDYLKNTDTAFLDIHKEETATYLHHSPSFNADAISIENEPIDRGVRLSLDADPLLYDPRSLLRLIDAARSGLDSSAVVAIPYLQFAEWQHQVVESVESTGSRRYWNALHVPKSANLPLELFDKEEEGPHQGEVVATSWRRLPHLDAQGVLALWSAFLCRLNSDKSVWLGVHHHGRDFEELNTCVGMLARLIPVVVDIDPSQPWTAWRDEVKQRMDLAMEHKDGLDLPAWLAANEMWDGVPFQFEAIDVPNGVILKEVDGIPFPFQLKLQFASSGSVRLQYSGGLLGTGKAEALLGSFCKLVDECISDSMVASWELAPAVEAGSRRSSGQRGKSLAALMEDVFSDFAEYKAVSYAGRSLRYGELRRQALVIASALHDGGAVAGSTVGICTGENEYLVPAMAGAWMAGCAYLPLDPVLPETRLQSIVDDATPSVLLVGAKGAQIPFTAAVPTLEVEALLESGAPLDAPVARSPGQTAYMIYTSGSTGAPKGVKISDANVVHYVSWVQKQFDLSSSDASVLTSSYAYDLGYTSLLGCLFSGGCIHLLPAGTILQPDRLNAFIVDQGLTFLKMTPSLFRLLLDDESSQSLSSSKLKTIFLGGEPFATDIPHRLAALLPECPLVNHYGPTETTIGTAFKEIGPENREGFVRQPVIGRAITGNEIRVTAPGYQADQWPGVIGEFVVYGDGVGSGYHRREAEERQRFGIDPQGVRWYRTGDVGYRNREGDLVFLGRNDRQVKIRGHRVELGEIASALKGQWWVKDAHVVYGPQGPTAQLTAYWVASDPSATPESIREMLGKALPEFMVPSQWVKLDRIPLTPNGKVDESQLPKAEAVTETEAVPMSGAETKVAVVWAAVLHRDHISPHQNFFELGGDSIRAIQIVARLKKEGIKLDIRDLFEHPTIRGLSENGLLMSS